MVEAQKKAEVRFIDTIKEKLTATPTRTDTTNILKLDSDRKELKIEGPVKGETP